MACAIFNDVFVNRKKDKVINVVSNKDIHINDFIQGYSSKPCYKKVLDVFEVKITKDRQRKIILDNGIELICSDNHALGCKDDGVLFDVFPDDLTPSHKVVTTLGLSKVKHVFVGTEEHMSDRFLDIIIEDSYYFCSNTPDIGMMLCYN